MLREGPVDLLMGASQFLEIATPRPLDEWGRDSSAGPSLENLFESFLGIDRLETTALLYALLPMTNDVALAAEVHAELSRRRTSLPRWVREIEDIEVTEVNELRHVLGDGDNVMVSVAWPSGREMTVLVYIDHNLGTLVKDAFPAAEGPAHFQKLLDDRTDTDTTFASIDPADAKARVIQAITKGERTFPPLTTETWPSCRSLVEWVIRQLPDGGRGYARPEWTDQQRDELAAAFVASPFAVDLREHNDTDDIVANLIWFACDYGPGDPLRWSTVAVEILLTDWFPRQVMSDRQYMQQMPAVLRALIRYAHHERSITPSLTVETIEGVDRWEPEYRRAIASPTTPLGIVQAMRGFHDDVGYDDRTYEEIMLESLAVQVGGEGALESLDANPIPDEAFDWADIPDDVHARVGEILDLTDRCCNEMLDVEYRTIARRLLAQAARGDSEVFRRKARSDYAAAALLWTIGTANDLFRTRMLVKDLTGWFDIAQSSVSQRATTLRKAAGLPADDYYRTHRLGDPSLLHSEKRASLIELRDRYREIQRQTDL